MQKTKVLCPSCSKPHFDLGDRLVITCNHCGATIKDELQEKCVHPPKFRRADFCTVCEQEIT